MTPLHKPVTRLTRIEVREAGRRRRLVVTLMPGDVLTLRPAGTRRAENVPLDACYALAVRMRVAEERAAKAKARKAR